jgi:hypothetical protein
VKQKVALGAVFGLSFFLVAVEIVRYTVIISAIADVPHILVWNYISAWASIVLASLPILRPLVFKRSYMSNHSEPRAGTARIRSNTYISNHRASPTSPSRLVGDEGDWPLKPATSAMTLEHGDDLGLELHVRNDVP